MTLEGVLVYRFKKKEMCEKKVTFNKDIKCYKARKFLWKNDLPRFYFSMKQSLIVFLSKV